MENLTSCPVCANTGIEKFIESKDYFLTGKDFSIWVCTTCGVKFTNPRPDKEEIGSYYESEEYISHDTTKKSIFNSVYKIARSVSLGRKAGLVKKYSSGNEILDIGCGTGEFLDRCRREGYKVRGVEPNPKAAEFARKNYNLDIFPESKLDEFPSASVDVVTLWHVLEHVHNVNERIMTISRILKPSGTLIIAVPNASAPDAKIYGRHWAAYDLPRHLLHFSGESMNHLAGRHDLDLIRILPMKMDAYYISLLSEKYMKGSQKLIPAFINGLKSNLSASKEMNYSSLIFILKKRP